MKRIGTVLLWLAGVAVASWVGYTLLNMYVLPEAPLSPVVNNNSGAAQGQKGGTRKNAGGPGAGGTQAPTPATEAANNKTPGAANNNADQAANNNANVAANPTGEVTDNREAADNKKGATAETNEAEQGGASGGEPADKRKAFEEKLEKLKTDVASIPTVRAAAQSTQTRTTTPEDKKKYEDLLSSIAAETRSLPDDFKALKESGDKGKSSTPLAAADVATAVKDKLWLWSVLVLAMLSGLLVVALLQLFSFSKRLSKAQHVLDAEVRPKLEGLNGVNDSFVRDVKSTAAAVGKLDGHQPPLITQAAGIMGALKKVSDDITELLGRPAVEAAADDKAPAGAAGDDENVTWPGFGASTGRQIDWATEEQAKPHVFPASVGDYVSMVKDSAYRMKPDYMNDVMVEDPENKGMLLLVKDPPAVKDGTSYVVPAMSYFRSKQDYINNYSNYFDCSEQSVGHVWINKPASVRKVAEGWKLVDRGLLEIRQ